MKVAPEPPETIAQAVRTQYVFKRRYLVFMQYPNHTADCFMVYSDEPKWSPSSYLRRILDMERMSVNHYAHGTLKFGRAGSCMVDATLHGTHDPLYRFVVFELCGGAVRHNNKRHIWREFTTTPDKVYVFNRYGDKIKWDLP